MSESTIEWGVRVLQTGGVVEFQTRDEAAADCAVRVISRDSTETTAVKVTRLVSPWRAADEG